MIVTDALDELERVAAYAETRGKKGAVLTRGILLHGKHVLFQERDPKCLRCYPTISRN